MTIRAGVAGRTQEGNRKLRWRNLIIGAVRHWFASEYTAVSEQVDALPDHLAPDTLYFVGEGTHLSAMAMRCPCGCGEGIHVNLLPGALPCWQVTHHPDGAVSLHPAIWSPNGCGSYFFVRGSRVYWWKTETVGPNTVSANIAAGVLQRSVL